MPKTCRGWAGAEGPPEIVDANGAQVAEPSSERRCWALVYFKGRLNPGKAHRCLHFARKGKLTCPSHRKLEPSAQALKASLQSLAESP